MAKSGKLVRKTGVSIGPILIYIGAVIAVSGALLAWDASFRRRQEEARKPPPPDVIAKNLVENIIGRDTVKDVKVNESAATVDVTFESATYPPAARSTVDGEVVAQGLVTVGARVKKGDPVTYAKGSDGKVVVAARAEHAGTVAQVLVKPGVKIEEGRAAVTIIPGDKTEARQNLETEGLLASQAILGQLNSINTVTSKIIYNSVTLATVVGKRGQKNVAATFHESLK
ncbi:MAG: hypothetical protein HYY39_07185 [Armatimonadetes bacterium]|nr:hypothetical protein [Armatimonadota bacterium]MBI2973552.1 hypothetical protein [Armatimonadota bacterium]